MLRAALLSLDSAQSGVFWLGTAVITLPPCLLDSGCVTIRIMDQPTQPALRNISDTARWVAAYRARETARPDAVFRDPFAARLAGAQGHEIAAGFSFAAKHEWAYVARTFLIDRFITQQVAGGVDMVVNLAAGLDSRPYRMTLPANFRWIEVDLPEILDYKQKVLKNDKPRCELQFIRLDLSDVEARRHLFQQLGGHAKNVLVLTEGLLIYLTPEEVGGLAQDLAQPESFRHLAIDLVSPGLLEMLQDTVGQKLNAAGASLKFAPSEGPLFFEPFGWKVEDIQSILKCAARLRRLSLFMRLIALLPEREPWKTSRPWSAICLFQRKGM
jgi:methyltransferase (TIGR00027 family)